MTIQPAVSEHADQMRRRILEGAARAFSRSGPQATSVPEIAAEAKVSVGLIYRYFSGKAELYAAACTLGAEVEMAGLMAEMAAIRDPRARLAHAVDFYLSRLARGGEGALLLGALAEAQRNPGLQASLRLRRDTIVAFIRRYLEERLAEGDVEGPVAPLARAIAMTMDGALTELALGDSDLGAVREAILDLLGRLLQASGPAPT